MTSKTHILTSCNMIWLYLLSIVLTSLTSTTALPFQPLVPRQAPNQIYIYNPTDQTASLNLTTFILPIPLSDAVSLASPYDLIYTHGLPTSVIPTGYFPMQITAGYYYDIRQRLVLGLVPAQVQQLSVVETYLPFVDVLGTGKAFRRSVRTYMDQLVPMLVGGVTQFHDAQLAYFDPAHAAYKPSGSSLSFAAAQGIVNTVDGPGLLNPLFQTVFSRTSSSPLSTTTFRSILDQPYYATPGTGCNKITLYYNFTNANPSFVQGNVQTFTPISSADTNYATAYGYTAATQWVEPSTLVDCSNFA